MKVLLDTHTLLWWFVGDPRLSARALAAMDEAEEVFYSLVSLWEVGLKVGKGGFDFPIPADWELVLTAAAGKFDMREAAFGARNCKQIAELPHHHGDPFDRMLIAQALEGGWSVVGIDDRFDAYGVERIW